MNSNSASDTGKPRLMFWLKLMMWCGVTLIIFGHYLWVGARLPETMGVPGIILVALCCAFGLILSLPTKIYLTILLMQYEAEATAPAQQAKTAAAAGTTAKHR